MHSTLYSNNNCELYVKHIFPHHSANCRSASGTVLLRLASRIVSTSIREVKNRPSPRSLLFLLFTSCLCLSLWAMSPSTGALSPSFSADQLLAVSFFKLIALGMVLASGKGMNHKSLHIPFKGPSRKSDHCAVRLIFNLFKSFRQ